MDGLEFQVLVPCEFDLPCMMTYLIFRINIVHFIPLCYYGNMTLVICQTMCFLLIYVQVKAGPVFLDCMFSFM